MRRSNRLILLVGIVLAVIAFIGIVLAFQDGASNNASTPQDKAAVYAVADIPLGTTVTAEMVTTKRVPLDQKAQDGFEDGGLVIGKVAASTILTGQQLRTSDFTFDGRTVVSQNVPKGLRAVAIRVDALSGVGTLVNVGDRVDVLVTLDERTFAAPVPARAPAPDATPAATPMPDELDVTSVKVVVQDLLVVGAILSQPPQVEGETTGSTPGFVEGQQQLVIVAVTPQQAEVIRFAQVQGEVSLALRSPKDYVDDAGEPIVPPAAKTTGIVLRTLLDDYGVLIPDLRYVEAVR